MITVDECIFSLKRDLSVRTKTSTLIAVAVIAIGTVGAILGSLWKTTVSMDSKVDLIREHQIRIITQLDIHVDDTNNGRAHGDQR